MPRTIIRCQSAQCDYTKTQVRKAGVLHSSPSRLLGFQQHETGASIISLSLYFCQISKEEKSSGLESGGFFQTAAFSFVPEGNTRALTQNVSLACESIGMVWGSCALISFSLLSLFWVFWRFSLRTFCIRTLYSLQSFGPFLFSEHRLVSYPVLSRFEYLWPYSFGTRNVIHFKFKVCHMPFGRTLMGEVGSLCDWRTRYPLIFDCRISKNEVPVHDIGTVPSFLSPELSVLLLRAEAWCIDKVNSSVELQCFWQRNLLLQLRCLLLLYLMLSSSDRPFIV